MWIVGIYYVPQDFGATATGFPINHCIIYKLSEAFIT